MVGNVASNEDPTQADRASVRDTYARYEDEGRDQLWDRSNPGFDRLKSDFESNVLGLLSRSFGQGRRAIDVGCGNGDLQVLTESRGLDIEWTGVDLLDERVATARQRYPERPTLSVRGTICRSKSRSFDVATADHPVQLDPVGEMETRRRRRDRSCPATGRLAGLVRPALGQSGQSGRPWVSSRRLATCSRAGRQSCGR